MNESRSQRAFRAYVDAQDRGPDLELEQFADESAETLELLRRASSAERTLRELAAGLRDAPPGTLPPSGRRSTDPEAAAPPGIPAPDAAPDTAPGPRRFGRFELRGTLGRGGLSTVYLAYDPQLNRELALKLIEGAGITGEWLVAEARALAQLEHPGVVRVFEVGSVEGHGFIAMERVRGHSLHAVIAELRRRSEPAAEESDPGDVDPGLARAADRLLSYRRRARLIERLAQALAACHDRGVLHRDIKPSNVVVDDDLQPVLIDFGLAHVRSMHALRGSDPITDKLIGTPIYMAPEQLDADRTGSDPRSDQFALGSMAYELLTLQHPFAKATIADTVTAISRADPPPASRFAPALPRELERILDHALHRDPERRYADVALLAQDLRAFAEHRPLSLPDPSTLAPIWRAILRHRALSLGVVAVCAAVLLTLGGRHALALEADARAVRAELEHDRGLARGLPDAFVERGAGLLRARARLNELRGKFLGWRAGRGAARAFAAGVEEYSTQLASAIRNDRGRATDAGVEFAPEAWIEPLELERQLAPGEVLNLRERSRGRIALSGPALAHAPADARVRLLAQLPYTLGGAPQLSVWHEIGFTQRPRPGAYRLLLEAPDGGTLLERDWVRGPRALGAPAETLELRSRSAPTSAPTVRLPADSLVLGPDWLRVGGARPSPGFAAAIIDEHVVSTADLIDWLRSGECEPALETRLLRIVRSFDAGEPALLDGVEAERYAAHRGRRLPSPTELLAGFQQGLLQPARRPLQSARRGGPAIEGESTSGRLADSPAGRLFLEYPTDPGDPAAWALDGPGDLADRVTWLAGSGLLIGPRRRADDPVDAEARSARMLVGRRVAFRLAHTAHD